MSCSTYYSYNKSLSGITRCKIENETNNTLKRYGYNLEHNFGYLDIWIFGYLDIWIFGYLDIWIWIKKFIYGFSNIKFFSVTNFN